MSATDVRQAVVVGAGAMGSGIAAQLANAGVKVRLLDVVPDGANEDRSRLAREAIARQLKAGGFMLPVFAERVTPGNVIDDVDAYAAADWVIEAVFEDLGVKRDLYATVEAHRGADTIVDPANPTRAIDDPNRSVNTLLYTPKGDYTVTATFGYLWRVMDHNVQLQLVVNNLLNDRSVFWTTSTNGAATVAQRPRDGNYNSPARETVPVGFGQKTPINSNFSASWRL